MCDLHQFTLPGPSPRGAIPRQIERALDQRPRSGWLKLYNSGNFFDPQSIPPADYQAIARQCEGFSRVIVENHPRFGHQRRRRFQELVGLPLEIAVGLETVQPRWLARLNKQMSRDDFDRYARQLHRDGVALRVFLIVGFPLLSVSESMRWARLSVRHAVRCGARHISLIPARAGHGWKGQASQLPHMSGPQKIELLEAAIDDASPHAVVTLDLWDMETNLTQQRLDEMNRSQSAG